MNINQLRYLIDISKTNSLNTTAKNMFLSQPSISEAIHNLEKELNCTILTRSKRGVNLTKDGEYVLQFALQTVHQYQELVEHFREPEDKASGLLRVGVTSMMTEVLLKDVIFRVQETYPEMSLHTKEMTASEIVRDVSDGKIDFGIFGLSQLHEKQFYRQFQEALSETTILPLYRDITTCLMHRRHPLAKQEKLSPADLQPYRLTSLHIPEYADDYSFQYMHVSIHAGIHKKMMQTQNTILPTSKRFAELLFPEKDFVSIPLEDFPSTQFFLIYRNDLTIHALEQSFLDIIVELSQKLNYT